MSPQVGWVITCVMFFVSLFLLLLATYCFQRAKRTKSASRKVED